MPDLGSSIFSQTDSSNNSGTMPSWSGSAAPSTIDDAGRALQGAVTREWNWRNYTVTATGTSDAKVLTYSVAPAAYYNGQRFAFIANTTNTGSATLNVNSLGAVTIKKDISGTLTNLSASDMVAGMFVEVAYNTSGTCFVWVNRGALPTLGALASLSTVGTSQIDDSAVTTAKIAANAVDGTKIALGSDAQGDVMYYDGTNYVRLGAGTSGHYLKTNGTGANPAWAAVSAGGATSLGTLTTTSGASQSLTSLTLTGYKFLRFVFNGVSASTATPTLSIGSCNVVVLTGSGNSISGCVDVDLTNGIGFSNLTLSTATGQAGLNGATGYSTATTTVTIATSSGSFDAGSVLVYGVA